MTARRAAQLARQIRAAAQEFKDAAADPGDAAVPAVDPNDASEPAAPTLASAADPSDPEGFAADVRETLDALRALVARNRHSSRHTGAETDFDQAAAGADLAISEVSAGVVAGSFDVTA